jgi:predicted Ser/Thr protein kinase
VSDPTIVDGPGALAPGTQFAGYAIEGVAGRGGMGIVYRARQLRPARLVALKVISPQLAGDKEFRERFAYESQIAASIEHSNVIPVYEVGEEAGLLYIAMRYVDGTDLGAVIAAEGRLAPDRAVAILAELAAALDAAHARGLVHRDVKPANVLIAREGPREHVYLTDFGLAKLSAADGRTRAGAFVGTLDYAAPEQLEGKRVDARTDVYAAGCLLYHMLTGSVPFPHDHEAAIMMAHLSATPRPMRELVPGTPGELDEVVDRAMAKDPAGRYPSAGDLSRAAAEAAHGRQATVVERSVATGQAAPAGADAATVIEAPERSAPSGRGRRRGLIVGGGVAALIAVVGIVVAIAASSSGGSHATTTTTSTTTPVAPPATKTYSNAQLGVSFSYPASWQHLSLQGSPADFGTTTGAGETRCALVIERGAAPSQGTQESQFAFVRARSAIAAKDNKHYELRAIQAEQGVNITGVGLVRVAGSQGGHLGFFFRGRDVYVFDCITPAASLDQVDTQAFQPLLASVRIG